MRYIVGIALMMMVVFKAEGQEREIDILLGNILESVSDENADLEEITAVFLKLLDNPLDLNLASKDDLNNLFILNDFQVESLLDYRKVYGRFYSIYELQYVDGFDKSIVDLLKPFITAGASLYEEPLTFQNFRSSLRNEISIRSKRVLSTQQGYTSITKDEYEKHPESRYLSGPQYYLLQFRSNLNEKVLLNITAENDPGEPFIFKKGKFGPDFFSYSLEYNGKRHLDKIILGDFSAGFGQGLVFWSSFNPVAFISDPLKIKMTDQNFKSYKSSGEVNFLRGCAVTLSFGKFKINSALSYRKLDAKISGDSFTVIYETGEHNTIGRSSSKKSLVEGVFVNNISYNAEKFKAGITLSAFGFNKNNGKSYSKYNSFQKYDGVFGNAGVDIVFISNGIRYFSEAAVDMNFNPAFIGGFIGLKGSLSYGCVMRYYSLNYNAPHASPYSQNTRPNNEKGVKITMSHRNIFKWKLFSSFDYTYFAGPRYRVSSPSYEIESRVELSNDVKEKIGYSFKVRFNRRFYDLKDESGALSLQGQNKYSLKALVKYTVCKGVIFTNRLEYNIYNAQGEGITHGMMIYHDMRYTSPGKHFSFQIRSQFFDATNWDNRVYVSESDISSLFSALLYGRGVRSYLLLNMNLLKRIDTKIKYSIINYFDRDKIGEGLSLIENPSKHELKVELSYKF